MLYMYAYTHHTYTHTYISYFISMQYSILNHLGTFVSSNYNAITLFVCFFFFYWSVSCIMITSVKSDFFFLKMYREVLEFQDQNGHSIKLIICLKSLRTSGLTIFHFPCRAFSSFFLTDIWY